MKLNNRGFTFVEGCIVTAVIGLLVAMAIPAMQKVRRKSQEKQAIAEGRRVENPVEPFAVEASQHTGHAGFIYIIRHKETGARYMVSENWALSLPTNRAPNLEK